MADLDQFVLPDSAPEPPPPETGTTTVANPIGEDVGLPCDIQAEKTILGAILLDNAAFDEASETLGKEDFSLDSHQRIYARIVDLREANQTVDLVTLAHELNRTKELESVRGVAYLAELTEGLPRRPVIDEYIRIVKDKAMLRRVMAICSAAFRRAADQSEPALDVLGAAESGLLEIAQTFNAGKLRTIADSVEIVGGVGAYMAPIVNPVAMTGLRTGFEEFDLMTGGLQKSELIIIAARPSMGKTGWGVNAIQNICLNSECVAAFFSLEMSREAIERRMLAAHARVNIRRAMSGMFLSTLEKEKLQSSLGDMVEARIHIDDSSSLTPTQMRAKARRLKQREGRLDVILADYLQLMTAPQRGFNRQEEVSHISRSLKALSKELEVPVVALAQLNRSNEARQDKRPILSDLRESGQIEQDADVVAFIHRPEYYDRDNEEIKGIAELIIAKQRNGPTGIAKLAFDGTIVRFDNLARY